ncbi:MFS multidrug transporter [Pleurostoma richardsiae]|uniref:MFS multidrug transporter n=1 Tax=Pleurostoma richardsiae TaxID=41990 RepID=A0AA38RKT4_9PEZI|nr:MFS multidrug transporter [Pleurostoma richardsiae]
MTAPTRSSSHEKHGPTPSETNERDEPSTFSGPPALQPADSDSTTYREENVEDEKKSHESLERTSIESDDESSSSETERPRLRRLSRSISEVRDGIQNCRDVELGDLEKSETHHSTHHDPNLVTWNGPNDPDNPKAWPFKKKWAAVAIVSCFTLMSPVSSTMTAPALEAIGKDLNITDSFERALSLSIFVLAYAIGPLLWGPLSELYGRVVVLQCTNLFFLFFNLGCGLARTKSQLIAFRFLAGFGGSAPLAIGGGVLSDVFTAEQRGRAMSLYSLMPLLGPAVGPIAGAYITQGANWRWVFYATTIADATIQAGGLFFLRETYAPVLLRWRRNRLAKETGNTSLHTAFDGDDGPEGHRGGKELARKLGTALVRPFRLLATQPIIQVLALYMMYLYGLMYLQLSTFPTLWASYGYSTGKGGLNYIAQGVGFFLGAQVCAPLQDRIYAALKRRYGLEAGRPEFRVPMMVPGAVLVPVGLLIYGWTAQGRTLWIGPDVGMAVFCMGTIVGFQCAQTFLVDTYPRYAASAVGAGTVLRSLGGFGFPLFAPDLYARLDYGWGNTLLACIAVVVGWPAPVLLWKYGETLRRRSPFAAGGQGL